MGETRGTIQTYVRTYAADTSIDLTTGDPQVFFDEVFLGMFNPTYQMLGRVVGRRWPERTRENTSLTMVVGDEDTLVWPITTVFKEPFWIEGLDANNSEPYPIFPAPNMDVWSAYDQTGNGTPLYWRLMDVGGQMRLALRPKPSQADTVRITSLQGVRTWPATASSTVDADVAAGESTLNVAATTPFLSGEHVIINDGGAREERASISSISAGAHLLCNEALTYAHTAAQGDTVELITPFRDQSHDMAMAKLISAALKAKRGETARAVELVEEALGLLPAQDTSPGITGSGRITPWSGGRIFPWRL